MNGLQLSHFLSMDKFASPIFKGLAMRDSCSLPREKDDPALYILNTDSKSGNGEHWCAIFYHKGTAEFFDPLGFAPEVYNFGPLITSREVRSGWYNSTQVQHMFSNVCGHHCLFFSYHRSRGMGMSDILKMYDENDTKGNDNMVVEFVVQYGSSYYPSK